MAKENTKAVNEVYFGLMPAKKSDRIYSTYDLFGIQICFGIAAWFFLTGSQTGMWLSARDAIATVLFGNCLPLFLMAIIAIPSARYGVEQMVSSIPIFGQRFTHINLVFFYCTLFPAIALACLMFGKSATKFWSAIFGNTGLLSTNYIIWAVLCLIVGWSIVYISFDSMKWIINIAAIMMVVLLIGLTYYMLAFHGVHVIFAAKPVAPIVIPGQAAMSLMWNRASGLEINVGLGLSWAFYYGQWTRLAKNESGAYHGCMWGWGALSAIAGIFSALAALASSQYDPTSWFLDIGRLTHSFILPVIGLFLLAVANVAAVTTLVYPGAVSFRTHYPKAGWLSSLLVTSVPALILFAPGTYERIAAIYSIIGLICAVYGAIFVADYIFITRGVFKLRHIFNQKEGYQYLWGFNPAAIIAMILGLLFYLDTLNPITWTSANGLFPYITAGIPTFVLTGFIYVVLMKVWVLKKWPLPIRYTALPKRERSCLNDNG